MIIDVSVYQGEINWPQIKADAIELAIIKATEGIGFTDARFARNWAGAKAAGVPRGAYHFAHPDAGNSPIAEASYFLGVVEAHGLDPLDRLAEDYEVPGGGAAWSLAFLGHLGGSVANLLEFYSNYSGCSRVRDARMAAYGLWLAYPGDGVHVPPAPWPWPSIKLWQFRVGTVPGISGNVDEDVNLGLFASGAGQVLSGHNFHPQEATMIPYPNLSQKDRFDVLKVASDGTVIHLFGTTAQLCGDGTNRPGVESWGAAPAGLSWVPGSAQGSWYTDPDNVRLVCEVTGSDGRVYIKEIDTNGKLWRDWQPLVADANRDQLKVGLAPAPAAADADDDSAYVLATDFKAHQHRNDGADPASALTGKVQL